ncbi:MAG: hypothetical protein AB7W28_07360 [Armatimonadota bacterium]
MPAMDLSLTVAQSKRLIARAVPQVGIVRRALMEGTVIVCKGSTTAYVAEELTGRRLRKDRYILGRVLPSGFEAPEGMWEGGLNEVVLRRGRPVEGVALADALTELTAGDVIIKGANALDYRAGLVGHLIGHPTGGTLGAILGYIHGKGAHLVVPVGLEKLVTADLSVIAQRLQEAHSDTSMPRFWITGGCIVTEIEALQVLTGVEVAHIASGGICGAEGAVWLRVFGTSEGLEKAANLLREVQSEPSYLEAVEQSRRDEG